MAANDIDVDGNLDPTTVEVVSGPSNGTVVSNGDGSITYTASGDFVGIDEFSYRICDLDGLCDTAPVTMIVNPAGGGNEVPVAMDDHVATPEDTGVRIDVAANDTDGDGTVEPLSVVLSGSGPSNGTAVNNGDGSFTYTPDLDFNGSDSFTYIISDNDGAMATATVTIEVTAVNDAPVAADDPGVTTPEDTEVRIDVAANDTDVDGNLDPTTVEVVSGPSNGTVVNNGDGSITYTPNQDYVGEDEFTYQICDLDGLCDTAIVSITVTPVNDAPVAADDPGVTTPEDTEVRIDVAANDTDVDGNLDPTTVEVVSGPSNGTVVNNGDGTITYTPNQDYVGEDEFT